GSFGEVVLLRLIDLVVASELAAGRAHPSFLAVHARMIPRHRAEGRSARRIDLALRLRRSLGLLDGLAMVVGITVGSGIFRTPGLIAGRPGRPSLPFTAWILGGVVSLIGAFVFAELSTRHPRAGGKYVYAGEAFGPRAAFAIGWVEAGIYCVAIAAI